MIKEANNILIVEDENLILNSLKRFLIKKKFNVDATPSGIEAVEMIKLNNYDKIICDLMLQDISGFDIIEESKKSYSQKELKNVFVLMTAYSSDKILTKARSYGCPILAKPFSSLDEVLNYL